MDQPISDIRKAENEVVFRKTNEQAIQRLAETKKVAAEEGDEAGIEDLDTAQLLFYCECMDDKCRERIPMTIQEYAAARKNKAQFVLLPGHHDPQIERIVYDAGKYIVVQKYMTPPVNVEKLNRV